MLVLDFQLQKGGRKRKKKSSIDQKATVISPNTTDQITLIGYLPLAEGVLLIENFPSEKQPLWKQSTVHWSHFTYYTNLGFFTELYSILEAAINYSSLRVQS